MSNLPTKLLGEFIEERTERLCNNSATIYSVTNEVGFIRSLDLFDKQVFSADTRNYKRVEFGNLAYNPSRINVGSVAICEDKNGGAVSPMYCVIRCKSGLLPYYLLRFLKSDVGLKQIRHYCEGAVRSQLKFRDLSLIPIYLPSLSEQERIVELLCKVDDIRRLRTEAAHLTNDSIPALFNEMFGEPTTNPKDFPRKRLGDIVDFQGGAQPPRSTFSYEPGPEMIRLIQIRDFKSDEFKTYIPRKLSRRFFEEDDVMIGRYGPPVFQILRGLSGSYNVALIKAIPKGEVTKDFIFHLLQEPRLHSTVVAHSERTSGQTGVNLELLEQYPVYTPPLELQKEFSARASEIYTMQAKQVSSFSQVNDLLQAMLHRAFNGEL